ncbi:galectin-3-binding protein [Sarotherodon galilaeus]
MGLHSRVKMVRYEVTVFTGKPDLASTFDDVYIKLVGSDESPRTQIPRKWIPSLKETNKVFEDSWHPAKVEVKSPEGHTYHFPVYHWITDNEGVQDHHPFLGCCYKQTNRLFQGLFWDVYEEGIPHCLKADGLKSLPYDICFSFTKYAEITYTSGTLGSQPSWKSLSEIYVRQHWKEDAFFGYQFLNGTNPMLIQSCKELPKNFPVTDAVPIYGQNSLTDEMKKGNIFLCDYKLLDGVETNTINDKKQYLMAPLVLLQKTEDNNLMPIAIQLKQKPAEDNPIFFPTDSMDWLLAKIFVRSADFNLYELNTHLLRTHLLAEVFTVSLLRNLPMVHPLYKLLIPHTRYTLPINILARNLLISEDGIFSKVAASGGKGVIEIMQRSLASMTYKSLCIVDDIVERGLKDVPNFFYRDDGLRLWRIIYSFVKAVLGYYYKTNGQVQKDSKLQNWIKDIFEQGFLSNESTGIPQKFTTVDEMVKFVTMVIFTCSAQHSAVNSGQFDFGGFMPNYPTTLQLPPPTKKGTATEKMMLDIFPNVSTTVKAMGILWLLSRPSSDSVFLGHYPDRHFTEEFPRQKIKDFQKELRKLSEIIEVRNKGLSVPYSYLDPKVIENSVSI